jgi:hypothetical protein
MIKRPPHFTTVLPSLNLADPGGRDALQKKARGKEARMARFIALCFAFVCLVSIAATQPTSAAKDAVDSAIFTNESNSSVYIVADKAGPSETTCVEPGHQASRYYLFRVRGYTFDFVNRCVGGHSKKTIKKDFRQPHTVYTFRGDKAADYRVDVST